jgi:hypothetical protein
VNANGADEYCVGGLVSLLTWVFRQPLSSAAGRYDPTLCHLDRSAAQWRDLRFRGPLLEMFGKCSCRGVIPATVC